MREPNRGGSVRRCGERCLFVNPASVSRIVGLTPTESRALLDLLFVGADRGVAEEGDTVHGAPLWDANHVGCGEVGGGPVVPEFAQIIRPEYTVRFFTSQHVAGDPLLAFPS